MSNVRPHKSSTGAHVKLNLSRLTIRPAQPEDALCLGVLGTQVFLDTYATDGIRPAIAREVLVAFSTAACAELLADSELGVEVAEYEEHLVGFHQVRFRAEHELAPPGIQAELYRLYVQEPFAGCGVGTALLRSAEKMAFKHGATVLWLTPWVHNHRALGFYATRGYEDCGSTLFRFEGEAHENRVVAKALSASSAA
jgi:GNAT superfamily N-acetyltransferase